MIHLIFTFVSKVPISIVLHPARGLIKGFLIVCLFSLPLAVTTVTLPKKTPKQQQQQKRCSSSITAVKEHLRRATIRRNALQRNLINFVVPFKYASAVQNLPIQRIMKQNKNTHQNLLTWHK